MGDDRAEGPWIFHLAIVDEWENAVAAGSYDRSTLNISLAEQGFIHCSFARQVQSIGDLLYAGRSDVVLLRIDPKQVEAEIRVENLDGGSSPFPHIYGPLPVTAVVSADEVSVDGSGRLLLESLLHGS